MSSTSLLYSGFDQFRIVSPEKRCTTFTKIRSDVYHIRASLDVFVYSNSLSPFHWLIEGLQTSCPVTLFVESLQVDQVEICGSSIYGLSTLYHKLYHVTFKSIVNSEDNMTVYPEKAEDYTSLLSSSTVCDLVCITANDESLFGIDQNGGVFKWPDIIFRNEKLNFVRIACGFDHVLLLSDVGAVYSFGNGSRGQLGHSEIIMRSDVPLRVEFFDDLPCTITDIACGGWHSLALTSDGDLYTFGWNPTGQLGHSSDQIAGLVKEPYPVDLGNGDNVIVSICAGARHTLALMQNGDVYSWGWNKYSQLGTGDNVDRNQPFKISVKHVSSGTPFKIRSSRWGSFIFTTTN